MSTTMAATLAALAALAAGGSDVANQGSAFEKRTFTGASGKALPYRLLRPDGYDPKGTDAYPLVVFLHGAGERGDDNEQQLKHGVREFAKPETRQEHPSFVVAPQCPGDKSWAKVDRVGGRLALVPAKEPTEPTGLVLELTDALAKEFRLDPKRTYITGLSMGGFGTWDLLARQPDRFAAAVPVCGGGVEDAAPSFAKVPIWAFHGALDPVVAPELSRRMVDALHKAGARPGYTEYPDVKHDSWTMTYRNPDVLNWMFAQKKK
jgi:predicted peptidase